MEQALLPVHGFVLAGGKSSRMGRDKALLDFRGRPLIAGAVERLRSFCQEVSISGNREDLRCYAPVTGEEREATGPAAGLEAGLRSCSCRWAVFVPVDVPMVPVSLLRRWAATVLEREEEGVRLSYLRAGGQNQPTFCLLHKLCAAPLRRALEAGERKLGKVFEKIAGELGPASLWRVEAEDFDTQAGSPLSEVETFFSNVNTPDDLASLTVWADHVPEVR